MQAFVQWIRHWLHVKSHTTGKTPSQKACGVVGTWRLSIMRLLISSRQLVPPGEQKLLASNSGATTGACKEWGSQLGLTVPLTGFGLTTGGAVSLNLQHF